MRAHYDYWGNALFNNPFFRLEKLDNLGWSTFLKIPYLPKRELVKASRSYVEILNDRQFRAMEEANHPSLWKSKDGFRINPKGILFGWLALFNYKSSGPNPRIQSIGNFFSFLARSSLVHLFLIVLIECLSKSKSDFGSRFFASDLLLYRL